MTWTFVVPAIAAALLVSAEGLSGPRRDPEWLGAVALGAVVISTAVLLAATVSAGRSVGLTVAGIAPAVAAVGLLRLVLGR
jgi:hypothetical protein